MSRQRGNSRSGAPNPAPPSAQRPVAPSPVPMPVVPFTIKLDTQTPVQVKVVKTDEPVNPFLILFFAAALFLMIRSAILWRLYISPRQVTVPVNVKYKLLKKDAMPPPMTVVVAYPQYIAEGDESELEVTVTNHSDKEIEGNLAISLKDTFKEVEIARPLPNESTVVKLEKLVSDASITQRVKFAISLPASYVGPSFSSGFAQALGNAVGIGWGGHLVGWHSYCSDSPPQLQLDIDGMLNQQKIEHFETTAKLSVAPIPYLRTAMALAFSSSAFTAVASLLWMIFQRRVLGVEGGQG